MSLPVRTVIQMADEYIRLDTTIIAIENLINEAATGTMARTLFKAKDTIYNQQRYVIDVQPVKRGKWQGANEMPYDDIKVCSECGREAYWDTDYGQQLFDYCPFCGARMIKDGEQDD